MPLRGVSLE